MATLKQHQAAMVQLLANGAAIPASATRLAHALHDVLSHINGAENAPEAHTERRSEATTSGLNDAALAYDMAAVKPSPRGSRARELETILKHRDNTIRQLRESNLKLRHEKSELEDQVEAYRRMAIPEQSGCRKEDTQGADGYSTGRWGAKHFQIQNLPREKDTQCEHRFSFASPLVCVDCGADRPYSEVEPEQAGCRKEDTQLSEVWFEWWHGARAPEPHVVVEIKTECGACVGPLMSKEVLWDTGRDYSPAEYRIVGDSE